VKDVLTEAELVSIFEKGNVERCINRFKDTAVKDRRALAKTSIKTLKAIAEYRFSPSSKEQDKKWSEKQDNVAQIAVYITATLPEIKKLGWRLRPGYEQIEQVISAFAPEWVDEWAEWLVETNPNYYRLVRKMVVSGLCNKPKNDEYILGMIICIGQRISQKSNLVETLLGSPDLLEVDVWRIFSIEGNGEYSLAASDKYCPKAGEWAGSLVELANRGVVSRDRLLNSSLDALDKDYAQFRISWFSRFHETLQPTIEERIVRVDRYLHLLGSQIPPTVTFALKALVIINKEGELPSLAFMDHVPSVLEARVKSTVNQALKLLSSIAKNNPDYSNDIARLSALALIHESADVQKRSLDIIDKFGNPKDDEITRVVELNAENIVPSLKNRTIPWLSTVSALEDGLVSEETFDYSDEYDAKCAVEVIRTREELVEQFSYILENPDDPLEIERVVDAVCRLGNQRSSGFDKIIGPLRKRALSIIKRRDDRWLVRRIAVLALSYVDGKNNFSELLYQNSQAQRPTFLDAFLNHLIHVAHIVESGKSVPLLSMPTHGRGFIKPSTLIARHKLLLEASIEPPMSEQVLALLRLDGCDSDASDDLKNDSDFIGDSTEFSRAIKFALGLDVEIGDTSALWVAAACIRNPGECSNKVLDKFGELGPDAGQGASYRFWVHAEQSSQYTWHYLNVDCLPSTPMNIPLEHLSVIFHTKGNGYFSRGVCGEEDGMVRWSSTVWPSNLEPYFSEGAKLIDITWSEAQWHVRAYFEPMLSPDVPLKDMALLLLAEGLGAAESGQKGIAIDIVIMAIDDGRLDVAKFAACMGSLLPTGYMKVSRWTKALSEISSVSNKHAAAVRSLIQGMLRHDPTESPRDLGGLIELLYELHVAEEQGLTDTEAISYFRKNKKGGKLGRFSKKLLAMS